MANPTGRPIAPARKLVAAVLGTIAVFIMVFGLGLSSWPIVALGAALLALSIVLGMVNAVRRGARAWVAGTGQVKAISEPPRAGAYGRAELQLTVVAPGLPINDVLVRESRVPVGKWPLVGDTLPISVDVDDMRRVRILWDEAHDRADDGDPPPPPAYDPVDDFPDDDLLGEPEPPPWATRDRAWGRGPDEPSPPPPPGADPIVVHDTPGGPVLEGQLVNQDDAPPPLPQRARTAARDPGRPPGSKPSPRARGGQPASATTSTATIDEGTRHHAPDAAATHAPAAGPVVPEQRTAASPGSRPGDEQPTAAPTVTDPRTQDDIDLPLDGDPEPAPEFTSQARPAVDQDIIAPPADAEPAERVMTGRETPPESTHAGATAVPPPSAAAPADNPPAETRVAAATAATPRAASSDDPPTETSHAGATAVPPPSRAASSEAHPPETSHAGAPADPPPRSDNPPTGTGHADAPADPPTPSDNPPTGTRHAGATAAPPPSEVAEDPPAGATAVSHPSATAAFTGFALGGVGARQRGIRPADGRSLADDDPDAPVRPWADLEGGYDPDERTDEVITAYPSARPGPAGAIHGVGITVLVTDLQRSIAFYRDVLGFFEIDSGTGSAVLASGDTRLVLRAVHDLAAGVGRLIYLNLEVGDVDAVYRELETKGVAFEHGPRPVNRGGKLELWAATFYDPDGHNIAITQWKAIR
ncbi:MAG TPA: VOC family protein [Actinoplanes sp.]|nr:VOC family protein [Actinoplanes sp.]